MRKSIWRKSFALLCVFALLIGTFFLFPRVSVKAEEKKFTTNDFTSFVDAVSAANASDTVVITVGGEIVVESDVHIKGKIKIVGVNNGKLLFENGSKKTGFTLAKNCSLTLQDLTVCRTVANDSEKFLFRSDTTGGSIYFENVVFDVATGDPASPTIDRITYCSKEDAFRYYFNGCTFSTEGYFHRGIMVFFNGNSIPATGGNAKIKDFNELKIDYETGLLSFPADVAVSEDAEFSSVVKAGSKFKSETTYYAKKGDFVFSFTTKNLKKETPSEASVTVDYGEEIVSFGAQFMVSKHADFSLLMASGDAVSPQDILYIKERKQGVFAESEVFVFALPVREKAPQSNCAFVCDFGFAMQHTNGNEYSLDGENWQDSPVFIDLESKTEYSVCVRKKATISSFSSESTTVRVTTK